MRYSFLKIRPSTFGVREALLILFAGAALGIIMNLGFAVLGITQSSEAYNEVANIQFSRPFWEGLFLYGVVAPVLEEAVFRLGIYRLLRYFTSFPIAMAASAVLFGVYHGNPVQGIYGFLMGLILAFLLEKYRVLYAPVLFHAGANIAVWIMVYL